MQIDHMFYPVISLGPNERLALWVRGCNRNCLNCCSPELQFFNKDSEISLDKVFEQIDQFPFKGVTISGGEPFLQVKELKKLVEYFVEQRKINDILIFTGYLKKELEDFHNKDIDYILSHIAVLVDGPYVDSLHVETPLRGSSNQVLHILNKEFEELYKDYLSKEKILERKVIGNDVYMVGIPVKDYKTKYRKI